MIKVENLNKSIAGKSILENVSLNVKEGSIFGLVGPNGAGKTTLIKTVVDIFQPDSGSILLDGVDISKNHIQKSTIAYVPDDLKVYSNFRKKDLVAFYRESFPFWSEERYLKLHNIFKIDENQNIGKLSKGMKMQLALHLSLSIMPKIIIMDEPTAGLDPVVRKELLNLLVQEVSLHNTTMLISSHNLSELEKVCDHIGFLNKGTMIGQANLDDMKEKIKKYQVVFTDGLPEELKKKENILKIENIGKVHYIIIEEENKDILNIIKKHKPLVLDTIHMTLEEIFIYKLGGEGYELQDINF